ncbi:MAG: hypothetical protein HDQ87_02730 [Clostridia bacterium]|nr:hypothetical protein [Clostridia bacterium]
MRIGKIIGTPVIAMKEGSRQGHVVDAVIDPENNCVSHYLISKDSKYDLLLVDVADVSGVGGDFMVVMDAGDIRRVFGDPKRMETVSRGFYLADAQALSASGKALGSVADFDLDEASGSIQSLLLEDGREFPADSIVAMSGTTVFVEEHSGNKAGRPATKAEKKKAAPEAKAQPNAVPVHAQRAYQNGAGPAEALRDYSGQQTAENNAKSSVKVNFRKMLIGKKMARDVVSDDGVFKANEGDTITEWMVQLAEQHSAVPLLMKHVEPS